VDPIHPIRLNDDRIAVVGAVGEARVRRETPEEASERRRREARERDRKRAARAWADSQLRHLEARQAAQSIVSGDDSDDGHPHCDVRV
jgi:glutathione S-transferase